MPSKGKDKTYLIILMLLLSIFVGVTLAFFSNSVFSTKYTQMSGKVKIEAVGKGEKSIEDKIPNSCNLEIDYDRDYGVLIPNMPIKITANCKVYKSTTMPLLRASFAVTVMDAYGNPIETGEDDQDLSADFYSQLFALVEDKPHWYYHSGYFYYVSSENDENSILQEINATGSDVIIPFIDGENGDTITVPSYIDSSSSGLAIKIKIIFQAIQNYIPDDNGVKMDNTISNSLKIFNEFTSTLYESSPISWFTVTTLADGTVSLSAKKGVTYPEYLRLPEKSEDGRTITHISSDLVQGNASIKNVYIPSTYTSMGSGAFQNSGLLSIDMSDSNITVIEEKAFYNSKLVSIKLPKTLVEIKSKAFYSTKLTSLEIPEECTTIGSQIISDCTSIIYLSIPSTLINYNLDSIGWAKNLTTIKVSENNNALRMVDGVMLISSSGKLLKVTVSNKTSITIPDDVTEIYNEAFYVVEAQTLILGKNLTSLDFRLPSNLQTLSLGSNTNFASLTDENGNEFITSKDYKTNYVTIVASGASEITIPDNIVTMPSKVDNYIPNSRTKNLKTLHLGASANINLNNSADSAICVLAYLENITVSSDNPYYKTITGSEVVSLDETIFYQYLRGAQNTEYTVPSTITTIKYGAFANNKYLQKLTILSSITSLSKFCYNMSKLTEVIMPSNTISGYSSTCFYNCPKLTSLTLNMQYLNNSCINLTSLKTITISNCTNIDANFLDSCTSLEWVEFTDTTPPTFASQVMMQSTNSTFVIYVPDASLEAYKTAQNLSVFASRIRPVSERG